MISPQSACPCCMPLPNEFGQPRCPQSEIPMEYPSAISFKLAQEGAFPHRFPRLVISGSVPGHLGAPTFVPRDGVPGCDTGKVSQRGCHNSPVVPISCTQCTHCTHQLVSIAFPASHSTGNGEKLRMLKLTFSRESPGLQGLFSFHVGLCWSVQFWQLSHPSAPPALSGDGSL